MKMNKVTLSFPKELEKQYQEQFFNDSLKPFRIAFLCVIALYALFGFLDNLIYSEVQPAFFQIRFGMVIPFLVAVTVLSFTKIFRKIWQPLIFLSFIISGLGIIIMLIRLPQLNCYYSGMVLIIFAGYLFIKLRFILAAIAGWLLLILFNLGFYIYTDFTLSVVIAQNFFYVAANLIGMFAAYNIEAYSRRDFYYQKELDEKNQKIEEANRNLENRIEEKVSDLKQSQEQYMLAVNGSNDGIWDWDLEKKSYFLSSTAKKNLGYEENEIENNESAFEKLLHPNDAEEVMKQLNSYLRGESTHYSQEFRMKHKAGGFRWILSRGKGLRYENGEVYRMAGSHTDITRQKKMFDVLRKKSEILYKINEYSMKLTNAAFDDLFAIIYADFTAIFRIENMVFFEYNSENGNLAVKDNFFLNQSNKNQDFMSIFADCDFSLPSISHTNLSKELAIVDHSVPSLFQQNNKKNVTAKLEKLEIDWYMQVALLCENQLLGMMLIAGKPDDNIPEKDEICNFASVTATVIVAKKAEKMVSLSEKHHRQLVENANEGILVTIDENIVFSNPKFLEILEYTKEKLHSINMFEFIYQGDREEAKEQYYNLLNNKKAIHNFPLRACTEKGKVKWLELSGVSIRWEGKPAILTFVSDVTERKIANDKIARSLKEKEILIQEIHHRVKNNLQMVSSLITLQARTVKGTMTEELMNCARDRIKAISIVHEIVYQSQQLDEIDTKLYIKNLCRYLQQSFYQTGKPIRIDVQADSTLMPLETAVPCALIINELVTNAYKHAFTEKENGLINIRFALENGNYFLEVRDNGVGIPETFDWKQADSLGLKIINTQVGQLKGEITLENLDGACFKIHFPFCPKREYLPKKKNK